MKPDLKHKVRNTVHDAKNAAHDINRNVLTAYDVKRSEIENKFPNVVSKLTPEEVRRSERIGVVFGFCCVIAGIVLILHVSHLWGFP